MELTIAGINWWAVGACVITGQILSTLWFTVLFGETWAREYGAESRQQHTKDIPGYTYGIQLICTVLMVITLAVLQNSLGTSSPAEGLLLGAIVAIGLAAASILPGQAFLRRWRVAGLTAGCQVSMILVASVILSQWK